VYQPLIPVFTTILAVLTGSEALFPCTFLTGLKLGGIMLGSGGAVVMVVGAMEGKKPSSSSDTPHHQLVLGNVLLVLQCMCTAIYVLLQKRFVYAAPPEKYDRALDMVEFEDCVGARSNRGQKMVENRRKRRWITKPVNMTAWA
jgi:hypothetical protein